MCISQEDVSILPFQKIWVWRIISTSRATLTYDTTKHFFIKCSLGEKLNIYIRPHGAWLGGTLLLLKLNYVGGGQEGCSFACAGNPLVFIVHLPPTNFPSQANTEAMSRTLRLFIRKLKCLSSILFSLKRSRYWDYTGLLWLKWNIIWSLPSSVLLTWRAVFLCRYMRRVEVIRNGGKKCRFRPDTYDGRE